MLSYPLSRRCEALSHRTCLVRLLPARMAAYAVGSIGARPKGCTLARSAPCCAGLGPNAAAAGASRAAHGSAHTPSHTTKQKSPRSPSRPTASNQAACTAGTGALHGSSLADLKVACFSAQKYVLDAQVRTNLTKNRDCTPSAARSGRSVHSSERRTALSLLNSQMLALHARNTCEIFLVFSGITEANIFITVVKQMRLDLLCILTSYPNLQFSE